MKKHHVLLLTLLLLLQAGLFASAARLGERPYVNMYQIPDEAMEQGRFKIKLTDQYSTLVDRLEHDQGRIERFGIEELDQLNQYFGVNGISLRFYSPALKNQFTWRHKQWGLHLWFELRFDSREDVRDIVMAYRSLKDIVQWAEPEYKKVLLADMDGFTPYQPSNTPRWSSNDPQLSNQWHYNNTGQNSGTPGADIDLFAAWDLEKGLSSVVVAIIDGGIQIDHPDLAANIWSGVGYNFVSGSPTIVAHNHGTHVAGTVAAVTNNAVGVAGIAGGGGFTSGVSLMSCQVFTNTSSGGFHLAPIYAADNGAAISQNSWGYTNVNVYDQDVLDAIDYFNANGGGSVLDGGITIFAAGNNNSQGQWYPGCYSGTFAVAATNNQDVRSYYSNYDTWVHVSAPGGETNSVTARGVLSTLTGGTYGYYQGTSMACPHVSGTAALMISYAYRNGTVLTNTLLANTIQITTDDHYAVNPSYIGKLGTGRINAYSALLAITPGMPMCSITSPASGSVFDLNSTINVAVTATDSDGTITNVAFYIDEATTPSHIDYTAPYTWSWNTTGFSGGQHTITAVATDNSGNSAQSSVTIILLAPADEGFESGNFSAYNWVQSGNLPWTVQSTVAFSGTYAARSGAVDHNQSSTMAVTVSVTTAGNISFYQRTSSESGYDYLRFYIDDVLQDQWSGEVPWTLQSYAVSSGLREFKWTYVKDGSVVGGSDCAWVDHIIFPPIGAYYAPPHSLVAAPGNGVVNLSWQAPGGGTPTGYKLFKNGSLLTTLTGLSYTDYAVVNGNTYGYYLTAVYPDGESDPTPTVYATPNTSISVVIGTGTSNTGTQAGCPINIYYRSLHGQSVYTAAELNAAGIVGPVDITQLGFYINSVPNLALPSFIIRMKHTSASNVSSWQSATGMVTVYSNASYMPTAGGYEMLTLDPPFTWNGTDNIVVDTAFDRVASWSSSGTVQYSTVTSGYRYVRSDNSNQTNVFTGGSTSTNRPNIKLTYVVQQSGPQIGVNPASLNFGTVAVGSTSTLQFSIQNSGDEILTGTITTPVGYMVAEVTRAPESGELTLATTKHDRNSIGYSVNAGASKLFNLTFAPTAVVSYNGNLVITHNAGGANIDLPVSGQGGQPALGISAASFSETLGYNETSSQTLTLSNLGNMPLTYSLALSGTPGWLTLNGGNTVSGSIPASGSPVNVTLGFSSLGLAPGSYETTIACTSNDPDNLSFGIPVTLQVYLPIEITSPAGGEQWQGGSVQSIAWNYQGTGTSVSFHYSTNGGVLWMSGGVKNSVVGANSFNWTVPNTPSNNCLVRLTDSAAPNYVAISDPFWIVVPAITVTPSTHNFGTVLINTIATTEFSITNTGTGTLSGTITTPVGYSVAPSRSSFAGADGGARNTLDYNIDGSGSATFTLSFQPLAVQSYSGNVTITHNASGSSKTIAVSGQGGKPSLGLSSGEFSTNLAPGQSDSQTLTISNLGNMALDYDLSLAGAVSWLLLEGGSSVSGNIAAGGAAQDIEIAFSAAGMQPGIYTATLNGGSNDPDTPTFSVDVTLTVRIPVSVSSPAGAEVWESGTTQSIQWNYSGAGTTVGFHYSTDGGSSWIYEGDRSANQGANSFDWTIPYEPSANCQIRLTDSVLPFCQAYSGTFSITTPEIATGITNIDLGTVLVNTIATVEFSIENSGTATLSGSITTPEGFAVNPARGEASGFASANPGGRNTLSFYIGAGSSQTFELSFEPAALQTYDGNLVITHNAAGDDILIPLSGQGGKPGIDLSSTSFAAELAPGGSADQILTIENSGNMALEYDLNLAEAVSWLLLEGGSSVSGSIAAGGAAQDIEIAFSAAGMEPGIYTATINGSSNDPDSPVFQISLALEVIIPLFLENPAGGESWLVGSVQTIDWNYQGSAPEVGLYLSTDDGGTWDFLENIPTSSGENSYLWTVPNSPSTACRLKLTDGVAPFYSAASNIFTIRAPQFELLAPNGGENWQIGSQQEILWLAEVPVHTLSYSTDFGINWNQIAYDASGLVSPYLWTVPAGASEACLVRIEHSGEIADYSDQSDAVFTIFDPAPPSAPENLSISYDEATGTATLNWEPSTGNPDGYYVYVNDTPDFDSRPAALLAYVPAPLTEFTDLQAHSRIRAFYRVVAVRNP